MQERISFTLTNIDDVDFTLKQLLVVYERMLYYYAETDIDKFTRFVEGCLIYFYMLYQLIEESKN
jgi:hypothetical protein